MRPKRLISLLVAVCMMITMLPLSAVTAFAEDTSSSTKYGTAIVDGYKYEYKVNEADNTATITKFLGPDGSAKSTGSYDITIPEKLDDHPVTGLGDYSFATEENGSPLYDIHHHNIHSVTIPESVTSIGQSAFESCFSLDSLIIKDAATSIGASAFDGCSHLTTLSLGKNITTIGDYAFQGCSYLTNVTIPESVTSIGRQAFYLTDLNTLTIKGPIKSMGYAAFAGCTNLTSLSLYDGIQTIGEGAFINSTSLEAVTIPQSVTSIGASAFVNCSNLSTITIPEKVTTIESNTFNGCSHLESIMLPAGLTSFQDRLEDCPAGNPNGAIYYKNYKAAADALLADNDANSNIDANDKLRKRNFLYLCKVTFDANGGTLTDKGGNPTDHAVVSAYKTKKINADDLKAIPNPTRAGYNFTGWYTKDGTFLNVNEITTKDMTEDITFYAHWAPVYHPLTVTGGTATVEKDGQPLNIVPVVTGDKKTYSVPDGAEVTVTLDKTAVPNGKVFDGWSTSLPAGQDYKAESITFTMRSGVNVSAKYRDAATDHTPGTAVCHPLTVTGGIVTVKNGDKDVTDTLTVTTDETTGKKTYSVPKDATVTVTLDKDKIPEGMVFDIWSTGKFSLPLGQDYKAETITFPMSSDVDIAAQYRDATIEDDGPGVLGTAAIIGTAAVGGAVLGYQAYSLGAEFAGKLMALPYFPSNRSALAMMLWEDAGKPMPESELLYPDVGQEEQDMDLQHAARWAMENELIPDLNDEGTAPEEMKFYPDNAVSKLDVLNAWQKAQELKNN